MRSSPPTSGPWLGGGGPPRLRSGMIDRCVQLHGGYGPMREYNVARTSRCARADRLRRHHRNRAKKSSPYGHLSRRIIPARDFICVRIQSRFETGFRNTRGVCVKLWADVWDFGPSITSETGGGLNGRRRMARVGNRLSRKHKAVLPSASRPLPRQRRWSCPPLSPARRATRPMPSTRQRDRRGGIPRYGQQGRRRLRGRRKAAGEVQRRQDLSPDRRCAPSTARSWISNSRLARQPIATWASPTATRSPAGSRPQEPRNAPSTPATSPPSSGLPTRGWAVRGAINATWEAAVRLGRWAFRPTNGRRE